MSVAFNNLGDLVALGCAELGQLLVWEWQSQQQALKQQSHLNKMACVAYSPNGQNLATGGDDGKVGRIFVLCRIRDRNVFFFPQTAEPLLFSLCVELLTNLLLTLYL